MPNTTRYILIALAVLSTSMLVAVGVIAARFNPNDFKPLIIRMVQEKKQRTLTIPGDIKLTLLPRIGVDLGRVSISERNSHTEFASAVSAKMALRLIPLLAKRLVVDHVGIEAMHANVRRFEDGSTNYDDLLALEDMGDDEIRFDVRGASIANASIVYDDQPTRRRFQIAKLSLETGEIASGVPSEASLVAYVKANNPAVDARIALKTGFTFYPDQRHYVFDGAEAELRGALSGISNIVLKASGNAELEPSRKNYAFDSLKVTASGNRHGKPASMRLDAPHFSMSDTQVSAGELHAEASFAHGSRNIMLNLSTPAFDDAPHQFKLAPIALDIAIKDAALDAKAHIGGDLTGDIGKLLFASPRLKLSLSGKQNGRPLDGSADTPVLANLKTGSIEFRHIVSAFTLPIPGGDLGLSADGKAHLDIGKGSASAALTGKFDESRFNAKFGVKEFSPASYTFDFDIDRLDADRYRGAAAADATPPAAPQAGVPASETPIDLSALRNLNAAGTLRIGSFELNNIKASNVKIELRAADGTIEADSIDANLYGGSISGSASTTATAEPDFAIRQNLAGIRIGPLMQDAFGKRPVEGRGDVRLDVAGQGASLAQIRKSLHGSAQVELHDGAIYGINLAQAIRDAGARMEEVKRGDAPETGSGSGDDKTGFSELTGSFAIADGMARNDDLAIRSPLLRVSGSGSINLDADRLEYLARTTVASTLQGRGGAELQYLKGVPIPVRLSGPYDAIEWSIDLQAVAADLRQQKMQEKKQPLRPKARSADDKQKSNARTK